MGALPKQKVSRSAQGQRRAHQALVIPKLVTCSNCNQKRVPHTVCDSCGYYKDEQVIEIRQKAAKNQ
ncbi:MAG: ribosomal protein [Chloroflexi bacterium]|jgi:large subunit ribosomal protein L32|nr:ribosomal protein [Chloroflexota bacterium]